MDKMTDNKVARFTNRFALEAQIGFTGARELRLAIGTISQVNPFDEDVPMEGFLPMAVVENIIESESGKPSKNIARDIKVLIAGMMKNNYVAYPTEIEHKGEKLDGYRVFYDRFKPKRQDGVKGYYYRLHDDMRIDLQGLMNNYTTFQLSKKIRSGTSIRFSMVLTAYHNKHRVHQKVSKYEITIEEFRRILGLQKKYPVLSDLRKRVVEQIETDINKSGFLKVSYQFVRTGRKVTSIIFHIKDGVFSAPAEDTPALPNQVSIDFQGAGETQERKDIGDFIPSNQDITKLSKAKLRAYYYLIERKCKAGIIYRQILPKMPSSEYEGWEDVFVQKAWERFETKTKYKQAARKAGAFIKWWGSGEFKDRLFSEVMEDVQAVKKSTSGEAWENRKMAMTMTASDFETWYMTQHEKQVLQTDSNNTENTTSKGMQSIGDLLRNRIDN